MNNKENQHSVSLVLFSALTAVAFLLINFKYCILYVIPFLGAGWFMVNYWNILVRIWQTLPRDAK